MAAALVIPHRMSQHPRSRLGSPSIMADSSWRSSTTVTFIQGPASPMERLLARSRSRVVLPLPGIPAIKIPSAGFTRSSKGRAAPGTSLEIRMDREEISRAGGLSLLICRHYTAHTRPVPPRRW